MYRRYYARDSKSTQSLAGNSSKSSFTGIAEALGLVQGLEQRHRSSRDSARSRAGYLLPASARSKAAAGLKRTRWRLIAQSNMRRTLAQRRWRWSGRRA
jgi:hypothetical protein